MNYRTLAKGALALSLSLIVGSAMAATTVADVQKYGATFESVKNTTAGELNDYAYEVGTNITKYAVTDGNPSGWFGAAEDESKIIARTDAAAGQALQLNTDAGVLTNKLESTIATDVNNNGIAKAGAFIETEAKFVASDTPDAGVVGGTDDTKFAIYAYADESKSPCTTNLVVYHAYYNGNGDLAYTNEVFDTLVDCDAYTKLRVEMKKMTNPANGQPANVFSVRVGNSTTLTSENAFDAYLDENLSAGNWFLTVEDQLGGSATKQLSSVTFKGTGEVDNLSVGIIEETTTYAVDWTGSDNVVVSNATEALTGPTATVDPATVITFFPTEGNVITNVFVGGVAQTFDPASYAITVNSDTNVVVLAGTQAAPPAPTVITIAQVGNVNVEDNNGTLTFTAPEGYTISSIYTNGVNTGSTSSFTTNGLTGNINIVVAAKKIRPAVAHKWYETPGVVGTNTYGVGNGALYYGPLHMSGADDFVVVPTWTSNIDGDPPHYGAFVEIFNRDDLVVGQAVACAKFASEVPDYDVDFFGGGVCPALNVAIAGANSKPAVVAFPLNSATAVVGENTFVISNSLNLALNQFKFTADAQYVYTRVRKPSSSRSSVYKWRVLNGLKTSGVNLVEPVAYDFGQEVRSIELAQINGADILYAIGNDSKIYVMDTSAKTPTAAELIPNFTVLSIYMNLCVTAEDSGTPRLTIAQQSDGSAVNGSVYVYTLNASGTALAANVEPIVFDSTALATWGISDGSLGADAVVTDDEGTLFLGYGNKVYAIQSVLPPTPPTVITVACVNGAEYTEANGVYTFSAPNGYMVSSVYTNGVSANTTTTLDLSAAEGDIKVVVAATKTRTAPTHKWYENPTVVGASLAGKGGDAGPYRFAVGSDLAVITYGNHQVAGTGLKLFKVDDLVEGSASPVYTETYNGTLGISSVRGAAISEALDVALVTAYNGTKVYSLPLSTNNLVLGETAFEITNDQGVTFDRAYFTPDNQFLYTSWNGGSKDKIVKWAIIDGLKGSGEKLRKVEEYAMPTRVRDFAYARINGKELFYVLQDDKAGVCVYDVSAKESTQLTSVFTYTGSYGSVAVSMTSTATPTLTVFPRPNGGDSDPMSVYQLAADGLSIVKTLATFTAADFVAAGASTDKYMRSAWPSEDDGTLFIGLGTDYIYAIQYVEPTYDVTVTVEGGTISTGIDAVPTGTTLHDIPAGTEIVFTATTGNTLSSVTTNTIAVAGIDTTATTYTYTVGDSDATVAVVFAEPPAGYNYPEGGAIEDATVVAWLTAKGFTQTQVTALGTNAKLNECYLLNCDISKSGAGGSIAITGITVDAQGVHVTVALTRTEGIAGGINGTLKLQGTADLATAPATLTTDVSVDNAKFTTDGPATATFTGTGATFFKAIVE